MAADFEDIVPQLTGDFQPDQLAGFHLDPVSKEILQVIDGKATVRSIIDKTGTSVEDAEKTLKLLKGGGLVKFPDDYNFTPQAPSEKKPEKVAAPVTSFDTGQASSDVLGVVPTTPPGMDVSGFHLDPVSSQILACVDGQNNLGQIAEKAGSDVETTVKTLNLLKGAGVVLYPQGISQLSVPAPPPMAPPPVETRADDPPETPEQPDEEPEDNTQVRKLKSSIPSPSMLMSDTRGFYFDPLSRQIIDMIDGECSLGAIVKKTGASIEEVEITLKLLNDGKVINWSPDQQTARPRSSAPPVGPAGMSKAPGAPAGAASQQLADAYSDEIQEMEDLEGTLEDKDIESLVDEADMASLYGSILCQRGDETVTFHFEDGEPKGVDTTSPLYADFGAMLHRSGFIDTEMLKRFRTEFAKDSDMVQALRRAGIDDPKKMAQLVVWRGETLFREVLGWTDGNFKITPGAPFPEKTARCRLKFITSGSSKSTGWRKGYLTEEQNAFFAEKRSMYLVPTKRAAKLATRMGLDETEKRYFKNVLEAAPLQLSRAMSISTLLKASTRKILYHLIDNGAFQLHETNPEEEPPIPLDELERFKKKLDYENHFSVLNAHAVSIFDEIKDRYERRLREFENRRYPDAEPHHRKILVQIRERIDKAWSVLKDDASRQEYRTEVYTKFQLDNFFVLQLEKADSALNMRQSPLEALPLARSAWDLRPGHIVAKEIIVQSLTQLGRKSEINDMTKMSARKVETKPKSKKRR